MKAGAEPGSRTRRDLPEMAAEKCPPPARPRDLEVDVGVRERHGPPPEAPVGLSSTRKSPKERARFRGNEPAVEEQSLPQAIGRRERLLEKIREAQQQLEERARKNSGGRNTPFGGSGGTVGEGGTESSKGNPASSQQINQTDPDNAP